MGTRINKARVAAGLVTAFICGLIFASSFDLTRFGFAQDGKGSKVAASQVQSLAETGSAFEAIADHVTPSVVSIQTLREARQVRARTPQQRAPGGLEDFFRNFDPQQQRQQGPSEASGTGFIVSKDGYILTNNHVVADADIVTVTLLDKRSFRAKVIGRDPTTDIAVIKVDGGGNLPVATLGDDNVARVGSWVVAIGNPLGLDFTVTAGIVSAKGRPLTGLNDSRYAISDFIQTDAAINPGNSGGPLVNIRGEVIGVNSAIASTTGAYAGYGFAIPVTLAKQVMDDLVAYGKVRRAVIGVSIDNASPEDSKAAGLSTVTGVAVRAYAYDADSVSPAKNAGIEPGDVIIAADGKPTDRVPTLQRIVRSHKPGESLTFDVMRFGSKKSFHVKLTEAPDDTKVLASNDAPSSRAMTEPESRKFDKLGISVEPISQELVTRARVEEPYRKGLIVSDVNVTGPSFRKLGADQTILVEVINPGPRKALRTAADLDAVLSKLKSGDVITLNVYDIGSGLRAVTLKVQ